MIEGEDLWPLALEISPDPKLKFKFNRDSLKQWRCCASAMMLKLLGQSRDREIKEETCLPQSPTASPIAPTSLRWAGLKPTFLRIIEPL